MAVRCHVTCAGGCAPLEHESALMPGIGAVFVFPGQCAIYEVANVLHDRLSSAGGDITRHTVAIVVRRKPAREIQAV